MSMSVDVSSNALSYLQSLLAEGTAAVGNVPAIGSLSSLLGDLSGSGATTDPTPAATAGSSGSSFDCGTMAALISLQGQSANGNSGPGSLFAALDSNGDGSISQSEFETTLTSDGVDQSSADALFAKLDGNGDGSISQSELDKAEHGHHHHPMDIGGQNGGGQGGAASLLSATDASGATTQTTTNADGSKTTVVSYADGSTVEMTTPAASTSDSGSSGSGTGSQNATNLIERLVQMQAQLLATAASTVATVA